MGLLEKLSWTSIVAGIITGLGFYFGLPEYLFEIRPTLVENMGSSSIAFIEGAICGAVVIVLVLKAYSYKSSPISPKKVEPNLSSKKAKPSSEAKKVKPEFVQKVIQELDDLETVFMKVVTRAGGLDFVSSIIRIDPQEENMFKKHIQWLSENYPKIGSDISRAITITHVDPVRGIKVPNFDPILQILNINSLSFLVSGSSYLTVRDFYAHLQSGQARLRAYLGLLKNEK